MKSAIVLGRQPHGDEAHRRRGGDKFGAPPLADLDRALSAILFGLVALDEPDREAVVRLLHHLLVDPFHGDAEGRLPPRRRGCSSRSRCRPTRASSEEGLPPLTAAGARPRLQELADDAGSPSGSFERAQRGRPRGSPWRSCPAAAGFCHEGRCPRRGTPDPCRPRCFFIISSALTPASEFMPGVLSGLMKVAAEAHEHVVEVLG